MNTHVPWFQSFLHNFVFAKLASSSIRINGAGNPKYTTKTTDYPHLVIKTAGSTCKVLYIETEFSLNSN